MTALYCVKCLWRLFSFTFTIQRSLPCYLLSSSYASVPSSSVGQVKHPDIYSVCLLSNVKHCLLERSVVFWSFQSYLLKSRYQPGYSLEFFFYFKNTLNTKTLIYRGVTGRRCVVYTWLIVRLALAHMKQYVKVGKTLQAVFF